MKGKLISRPAVMLTAITVLSCFAGYATAEQFKPPSLEGFTMHAERDADGDGDGTKETHIKQYLNTSGDSLVSMTTNGRTWAWTLNTRGNDLGSSNYVIMCPIA